MKTLKYLVVVLTALTAISALAGVRTDVQMRSAASRVLRSSRPLEQVAYYPGMVLYRQAGGGFAIVSSDDRQPAVLAYSPCGTLSLSDDNPGFKWWLNAIRKVMLLHQPPRETTTPDPDLFPTSVQPLLTTTWGQREPFKFMCPFDSYVSDLSLYGTYTPDAGHYSVGCGPLAMAQYMNYYKFPKHGTGEESVTVKYDQGNVIVHVDFEQANYDWGNKIDDYQGEYTYEQGRAVAELCYHCGVAAQTTWNNLGGGTNDQRIVEAFTKHFNYNDTAHFVPRSRYDEPTWMEMIYSMLSSGNPILYSAKDINLEEGIFAGHNFIIDGYDENGLVHVNWGWYGVQNGYFDIATLAVLQYTYDDWQAMYVGLYPNQEDLLGDVNGDGNIDISDATTLIGILLNGNTASNENADVNEDGHIDISDATILIGYLLSGSWE
ncbi:MAG: C10 family peptidase [Muribaculaceae bacterium]|nr:C10 family peptidase [Muribaculaceae bacterium]